MIVGRFDSKVPLAASSPFDSRVTSNKHACEVNRTVKVFNEPADLYGSTKTDGDGKWSIPASPPNGDCYARVLSEEKAIGNHEYILCRGDRSATRHLGM